MARLALVYSLKDPAGSGTASILMEMMHAEKCSIPKASTCRILKPYNVYLAGFSADSIHLDFLDEVFGDVEGYIVLSRHSGGRPSLTVHHPGNPTHEAPYGGKPRSLPPAWPRLAAALLRAYRQVAEERGLTREFHVTLEATHHGPTELTKPIVFIEIGSSEREWVRRDAWEAMAETVVRVLSTGGISGVECRAVAVGVGDTHYPARHTRYVLEERYCYGHIFSKHVLDSLDEQLLSMAIERSVDEIDTIVLAKVPSRVKQLVGKVAERYGLKIVR